MKALKHIGGILLATVGVMFVLGAIQELFDRESVTPWWMMAIMFFSLGLLPLAGSVALLWRSATELPPTRCPQCGGVERAHAGLLVKQRHFWMTELGGWLFGSLWGASRAKQVRCVSCDTLYFTETRGTRIAGILVWVFILLWLVGTLAQYFQGQK